IAKLLVPGQASSCLKGRPGSAIGPPVCRVSIGWRHGIFVSCRISLLEIETSNAFHVSVRNDTVSMSADHDVGIGRVGPHRHPATLFVHLEKGSDHIWN